MYKGMSDFVVAWLAAKFLSSKIKIIGIGSMLYNRQNLKNKTVKILKIVNPLKLHTFT